MSENPSHQDQARVMAQYDLIRRELFAITHLCQILHERTKIFKEDVEKLMKDCKLSESNRGDTDFWVNTGVAMLGAADMRVALHKIVEAHDHLCTNPWED